MKSLSLRPLLTACSLAFTAACSSLPTIDSPSLAEFERLNEHPSFDDAIVGNQKEYEKYIFSVRGIEVGNTGCLHTYINVMDPAGRNIQIHGVTVQKDNDFNPMNSIAAFGSPINFKDISSIIIYGDSSFNMAPSFGVSSATGLDKPDVFEEVVAVLDQNEALEKIIDALVFAGAYNSKDYHYAPLARGLNPLRSSLKHNSNVVMSAVADFMGLEVPKNLEKKCAPGIGMHPFRNLDSNFAASFRLDLEKQIQSTLTEKGFSVDEDIIKSSVIALLQIIMLNGVDFQEDFLKRVENEVAISRKALEMQRNLIKKFDR